MERDFPLWPEKLSALSGYWEEIVSHVETLEYSEGQTVFYGGTYLPGVFVLCRGSVKIRSPGKPTKVINADNFPILGADALYLNLRCSYSVTVLTDANFFFLPKSRVLRLLQLLDKNQSHN
jgi:signal-transduction protein with cAMP-binding, CBS, and nucleotidyltransferase domain